MAATLYVLYFARETEHIEGRKSACALRLRSHMGHVSSFWTVGFHESNGYLGWWSSLAFFGSDHSILTCMKWFESPWASLCPRAITFCVRGLPEACPRPALGEPRSASNANKLASSWPLKQGRKKCSKHGCDRGTSTVLPRKSLTETNTMDGCIFPYETRGVPPLFVSFVGDGMFGSLSLAYNASPLSSLAPPFKGGSDFITPWIRDRGWQSRGWLLRPWRPMTSWSERTLREISS